MPKLTIVQEPRKILRAKAKEIPLAKISSPVIQTLIKNMSDALQAMDIGVGLAAPQVGKAIRLFLVSEEATLTERNRNKLDPEALKESKKSKSWKHLVFINPKILKSSKKKNLLAEGCLSVKDVYGRVRRHEKVLVEAYDEQGKKFVRGASGLFAQVIQHEADHLDGVLFIDKATEIKKLTAENGKG